MAKQSTKTSKPKNAETSESVKAVKQKNRPSDQVSTKASSTEKVKAEKAKAEKAKARANTVSATADLTHADRIVATLANVEKLLNQSNEKLPAASTAWTQLLEKSLKETRSQISDQLKGFKLELKQQLNEFQETVSKSLNSKSAALVAETATADSNKSEETTEAKSSDKPETDWEHRKREMYAKYGQDTSDNENDAKVTKNPTDSAANNDTDDNDEDELTSLQESLHDSIESLDEVQADEVEELRTLLTKKLREAGVELSINRAKLAQRKAKLERQQSELEAREKSLASKYSHVEGKPQKKGVLDRLTRHLGARKKADSL